MTAFERAIENVKILLASPDFYQWDLVIYILRDFEETEKAGLSDLAWAHSRQGDTTENEARDFVEKLYEKYFL